MAYHEIVGADLGRIEGVQVDGRLHHPHDARDGIAGNAVPTGESPEIISA
ncbi:hypothetical protein [Streptomyces prasinus]